MHTGNMNFKKETNRKMHLHQLKTNFRIPLKIKSDGQESETQKSKPRITTTLNTGNLCIDPFQPDLFNDSVSKYKYQRSGTKGEGGTMALTASLPLPPLAAMLPRLLIRIIIWTGEILCGAHQVF